MTKFASVNMVRNCVLYDGEQDIRMKYGSNFQTSFSVPKKATDK